MVLKSGHHHKPLENSSEFNPVKLRYRAKTHDSLFGRPSTDTFVCEMIPSTIRIFSYTKHHPETQKPWWRYTRDEIVDDWNHNIRGL